MTEAGQEAEVDTDASVEVKEKKKSMRVQIRENSWFGKKCLKIFKVFTNTFGMTFLAEWGDRYIYINSLGTQRCQGYKKLLPPFTRT